MFERTYESSGPGVLPHSTNLSQVMIEQLLAEACKRAGVEVAWDQAIATATTTPRGVALETTGGTSWEAEYVLAADGARSALRRAIGAELEGDRSTTSFIIADVAEDEVRPLRPERRFYYQHPAVGGRNVLLVPFAGGWRADLQLRVDDDPEEWNDEAGVRDWIARVLPPAYADRVTWVSTYQFLQVVADRFTDEHRRVLLAGEAAHLFAPFGARGLNSGIPDVRAAADAIVAGTPAAVDSFATTRREAVVTTGTRSEPSAHPHAGRRSPACDSAAGSPPAARQGESRPGPGSTRRRSGPGPARARPATAAWTRTGAPQHQCVEDHRT